MLKPLKTTTTSVLSAARKKGQTNTHVCAISNKRANARGLNMHTYNIHMKRNERKKEKEEEAQYQQQQQQ